LQVARTGQDSKKYIIVHQDSCHLLLINAEDPSQCTYLRNLAKKTWCLDTTGREDREWNEAQRQGEVRVTFWITLMVMKVKIHCENYRGFGAIYDTCTTLLTTHGFKTLIHFISYVWELPKHFNIWHTCLWCNFPNFTDWYANLTEMK